MIEKLRQKILQAKFGPLVKRLVIVALCVVLLGTALSAALLRPQITQAISAAQLMEEYSGQEEWMFREQHGLCGFDDWEGLFWHVAEPSVPAKVTLAVFAGALLLLSAAYWLLIPAWLYQAAKRSQMNGLLWPLLGLVLNLWALALFLILRSALRQHCAACGLWQRRGSYCHACGKKLLVSCPFCREKCGPDSSYCPECGAKLHEQTVPPDAAEAG